MRPTHHVEAELLLRRAPGVRRHRAVSTLAVMPMRDSICATAWTIFSSLT
jgi:hypothetical protein